MLGNNICLYLYSSKNYYQTFLSKERIYFNIYNIVIIVVSTGRYGGNVLILPI